MPSHTPSRASAQPSTRPIPRRKFLQRTATAASAAAVVPAVWSEVAAQSPPSANSKLRILCVGTANRAAIDIDALKDQNLVGMCDLDQNYLDKAKAKFPAAKTYVDYRDMIAKEADSADAIMIGTSDHHHAPIAIRAIEAGLHCYCEKPLTHTIEEARLITDAAREKGVVTQMGTQIHAGSNYRRVVELIQAGVIGDVNEVHVWVGKNWGGGELPKQTEAPPAHLNWDLWLGPAPERPYAPGRYHPAQWRRWWAFGQGTLGDMGCHYMDLPFWALGLKYPTECEAEGATPHPETCPNGLIVRYSFPREGKQSPIQLTWYDGNKIPKKVAGERVPGSGVMFVGSEGKLFSSYTNYRLFPREKFKGFQPPAPTIPESIGHHAEWVKACKDGSPTTCNFDYSGPLTETVLLGNVAYRTGEKLIWDAKTLTATNAPSADQYVRKEYRPGWEVKL